MIPPARTHAPMQANEEATLAEELPAATGIVVAAVIKHAFGMAVGAVTCLAFAALAILGTLRGDPDPVHTFVWLMSNYFPGISPTGAGVFAAVAWGFGAGYAAGWCTALARNRIIKFHFWFLAARERLSASRDVLDDLS